ncbi:MAG: 30S ribosomal protein S6 [Candidatus Binatia bacterium]
MTQYETLMVVHPERGPRVKEFIERFQKVIEGQSGTAIHVEEWGLRDLAYRIDKQSKGYYTLFQYQGTGQTVQELERNLKLADGILRYMTVRTDEPSQAPAPSAARAASAGERAPGDEEKAKSEPQS